jgi:hypothetical protein
VVVAVRGCGCVVVADVADFFDARRSCLGSTLVHPRSVETGFLPSLVRGHLQLYLSLFGISLFLRASSRLGIVRIIITGYGRLGYISYCALLTTHYLTLCFWRQLKGQRVGH